MNMNGLIIRQLTMSFENAWDDIHVFAIIKRNEYDLSGGFSYVKGYPLSALWNNTVLQSSIKKDGTSFHLEFK